MAQKHSRGHFGQSAAHTGCTVNGKSTTVSYKVHKVSENQKEEYQIISNMQEAIIDENVWLRVQELRKNKRRPTKTNRKSLFSRLVFCVDCKSKLYFCAANPLKRNQEFFRCANYKDGGADMQHTENHQAAHRIIKRRRCNPPKIGLYLLPETFTALLAQDFPSCGFYSDFV